MFDILQDLVLVIDANRNLYYGNNTAANLFQVSNQRLAKGKPLDQFMTFKPDLLEPGTTIQGISESTQYREVQFEACTGTTGWVQASLQAVPAELSGAGEENRRWVIFFRDVSLEKVLAAKYKAELDQKESVIEDLKAARAQLEDYSKNLEKMVEQRTQELRESNRLLSTVLDSLGQGILVFNREGQCLPIFSRVCKEIFGQSPAGLPIAQVMHLDETEKATFAKWLETAFAEMLSFEDMVPLAPQNYAHPKKRHISLNYNPMRNDAGTLEGVVLVATDRTDEMQAKQEAERERAFAKMVVQITTNRQQFRTFAGEAKALLRDLQVACQLQAGDFAFEEVARWLHTIKGGASSFGLTDVADIAHHCESLLMDAGRQGQKAMAPETREQLLTSLRSMQASLLAFFEKNSALFGGLKDDNCRYVEISVHTLQKWTAAEKLETVSKEIYSDYLLAPISSCFSHIDAMLQDLAPSLGKKLKPLQVVGGDLKIVPEVYSDLFATFVHAFRNAVDHGLEKPELRMELGKPEAGTLQLRFAKVDNLLRVEIVDDGGGIDPAKIRAKLESLGQASRYANVNDEEVIQAIFNDDFSTAAAITTVSGRGVGLAAIKERAVALGGKAWVASMLGTGSKFTIEVPWMLERDLTVERRKSA